MLIEKIIAIRCIFNLLTLKKQLEGNGFNLLFIPLRKKMQNW